ncbi:PAS domain S-box protein [Halovenus halobia]|uniref:PAS domain S-box protein n=1 Tax=Halovenus halobia TaxID=3396622 RepID=UPI003F56FBD5
MSDTADIQVLHVDDDPAVTEITAEVLERERDRLDVDTAHSASEGADTLAAESFDCIVCDYQMPGQTGLEFLETIREEYPELPFILYTGRGSEAVASDAIAAGATDYLQKASGTEQYELLANRIENAVEQYRSHQRATELNRIHNITGEIKQALVRADSRVEVETRTCEIFSQSEPYMFAWIGDHKTDSEQLEPRAWAGVEEGYLENITVTADDTETGQGPGGTAVRERRVAVSQNIHEDAEFEPWRGNALERGYQAVAAVPLEYEQTLYGVLGVYSARPYAFDEEERELLAELGGDVAHAIHSLELQATLRAEREFIEQALSEVRDIFYVADTDGTLRRWNDRAVAVSGYSEDELDGMAVTDFFGKEDQSRVLEALDEALTTGESVVEAAFLTADGDSIPYEFKGSRLTDTDGDVVGVIGVGRDISDRQQRERELQRYETIVEAIGDPVYRLDAEGNCTFVNDALVEMTGYEPADLRGEHVSMAVPDEHVERGREVVRQLLDEEHPNSLTWEMELHTTSGDVIPVENHVALVPSEDGFRGTAGVIRDITDRKQRKRDLEEKNQRLDEFAGIVSHDLRNPLNVAQLRLELARQECPSEHLDDVAHAHERMETLIDDVLAVARQGDDVDETQAVNLATLADSCWRTVETADATLRTETEQTIRANSGRLKQLLENLFSNAVAHGGDDVTVTIGSIDSGGFYIEDDGPGVPEDARDRLFEAGYSTTTDGTGFGLNIVQAIADAHGWTIAVTDSDAGGARFEITGVEFA